ncbi:MAG: MFS transporter [Microcoleaceae cyanobacterium]
MSSTSSSPTSSPASLDRIAFWALCLALFVISYNISVIPPIMPLLVRDLDSSMGYIQIVIVLFSLVTASFSPTCENLCRFYGREQVFLTGLVFYGLGILWTAMSSTIGVLVVGFSFLTGLAATPLVSEPWAIMDLAYEGKAEKRATLALILFSTCGGLAGSILGGFIASKVGWRWAFMPSLLILVFVAVGARKLPPSPVVRTDPIDWIGGLLSLLGLGSILMGISLAGEYGWWFPKEVFEIAGVVIPPFAISIVPTLIAVGIVCLGLLLFWQRQQVTQAGVPLVRVGLLRRRTFILGLGVAMLHTLITTGVQFNLYQFLPAMLPLNPFQTAIAILPYNLTLVVVLIVLLLVLKIDDQIPPKYNIYLGLSLLIIGLGLLRRAIDGDLAATHLIPGLVTMGIGSAFFLAYIGPLTYSAATRQEKPEGTGIYSPMQRLASSLGRGILGTLLISFTSKGIVDRVLAVLGQEFSPTQRQEAIIHLERIIQTYSEEARRAEFANLPDKVQPALENIIQTSAVDGIHGSLFVALSFAIICFLIATFLPKYIRQK